MKPLDFRVPGFLFSGISSGIKKDGSKDLGLIYSEVPAQVAGLFTANVVKAAPVQLGYGARQERSLPGSHCQQRKCKCLHRTSWIERCPKDFFDGGEASGDR